MIQMHREDGFVRGGHRRSRTVGADDTPLRIAPDGPRSAYSVLRLFLGGPA